MDKSGEICDACALKDKRIKVIHKKNGGVSAARNTGLQEARGEYITYADSDDLVGRTIYRAGDGRQQDRSAKGSWQQ